MVSKKTTATTMFFSLDDYNKISFINKKFKLNAKLKKISCPEEAVNYFKDFLPVLDMEINLSFNLGKPNPKTLNMF